MESPVPSVRIVLSTPLGEFSWRWPESVEHFFHGWALVADVDGREIHLRHGVGGREVFGGYRAHSVTWLENDPTVEGVAADDYATSRALLSLVKVTKKHVRPTDPVPAAYSDFELAVMADQAPGPRSPRSMAVKLREDDLEGWARHAVLRAWSWGRLPRVQQRKSLPYTTSPGPAPPGHAAHGDQQAALVDALLAFGATPPRPDEASGGLFSAVPEADALVSSNGFAFLCAVIFDQGIPAERAWLGPYLLYQRLGHLDVHRIATDDGAVTRAVQQPPKLHRYVEKLPTWIVEAARLVVDRYDGRAENIWAGRPRADELQQRFDAFPGIGQKKAAMAVEILERDLGVPVADLERSDIAYDVHVRRVFLRARLADRDEAGHMIAVARRLHPTRPGQLDLPTWRVGRTWCRPALPLCARCPLTQICPKDIERAAQVTGG